MLHESDGVCAAAGESGDPRAERLPDTTARLVIFTVVTETRSGRKKTSLIRVLTTLLDHEKHPAREITALYAEKMADRNSVPLPEEDRPRRTPTTARPVPGTRPPGSLAWLLLIQQHHGHRRSPRCWLRRNRPWPHPLHRRARPRPRPHRRRRPLPPLPTSPGQPGRTLASLTSAILAIPRHRAGRRRTFGRTTTERRTRHTEEVTYIIEITKSNLPQ